LEEVVVVEPALALEAVASSLTLADNSTILNGSGS
jgi:hypothetical protein